MTTVTSLLVDCALHDIVGTPDMTIRAMLVLPPAESTNLQLGADFCALGRLSLFCSGRGPGCPGPPAQIPACGFPAPGSCRRSNAIEVRGFGGPCTSDPQARSFGYTPYPALSPGRALLLVFPSAGRLPSTISAPDFFGRLCSRLHRCRVGGGAH